MQKFIMLIMLLSVTTLMMARRRTAAELINTGDHRTDSIILYLNEGFTADTELGIGKLYAQTYIKGTSTCTQTRDFVKYVRNLIPFETVPGQQTAIEALANISYQDPCEMLITPIAIRTNNNRMGRRILEESYKILFPLLSLRSMQKGVGHAYVLPFSDDGLQQYDYQITDTLTWGGHTDCLVISFSPHTDNHSLLTGCAYVSLHDMQLQCLDFSGLVDFGKFHYTIFLANQHDKLLPVSSQAHIDYNYNGILGSNDFQCHYIYKEFATLDELMQGKPQFDLSDVYQNNTLIKIDFDTIRPLSLSPQQDSILSHPQIRTSYVNHRHSLFQSIPERLVGSSDINAFGTDLRIYGPLYPASVGYDKLNGITLRERLRWSHQWHSGHSLLVKPEFGYSFGQKAFRYRIDTEWVYNPAHRAGLKLSFRNSTSGFSSKFKKAVDDKLHDYKDRLDEDSKKVWRNGIDFDDLGLEYYNRYIYSLEHAVELSNGLMFYAGVDYNYRKPVRHGSRAMSQQQIDLLVDRYYADMNPYLRLTWTPRQYYHYKGSQKLYLGSRFPTFSAEYAQGIYGFFGSTSNYSRIELDMNQTIRLDDVRTLSYHIGAGTFMRQSGEYFINYRFFSRSQYPSTWDNRIGGVFSLLDDYWYSSSPAYYQSHVMYESPFMLLHSIRPVAKYVIKERAYGSTLIAHGKNIYTELGYGMGNNYFNLGFFCGFAGLQFMDAGVKFTIEIDQHL